MMKMLLGTITLTGLVNSVICAEQQVLFAPKDTATCSAACEKLSAKFGEQARVAGSALYDWQTSRFWSLQQSETRPACFVRPANANEVAAVLHVARDFQCPFAVRSGGHTAFKGASNIEGGITIDLGDLRGIDVAPNRETVYVGPGLRWYEVYKHLEAENLGVIGGRVGGVGVGGLTLGGGISFFSNEHGWALDNVASYEVVAASGGIYTASPEHNPDLYWAIRGGGSNFGIVTKFELNAFPFEAGLMWGGNMAFPGNQNVSLFHKFEDYLRHGVEQDSKSSLVMAIYYLQGKDEYMCGTHLEYAEPLKDDAYPAVLSSFKEEPNVIRDTTKTQTLADISFAMNRSSPDGLRQSWSVATFSLDVPLLEYLLDVWTQVVEPIKKTEKYIPVFMLQLVSVPQLRLMSKNGGNALGLSDDEPLVMINVSAMWANAEDDEAVHAAYNKFLELAEKEARKRGLWHDFIYMNYASLYQNPLKTYGKKNVAKLKKIAKKWDPEGVFAKLQPGHFKL